MTELIHRPARLAMWRTPPSPLLVAHRGAEHCAPENTMAAFQAAVDSGADVVELDVQLSADAVAVVVHDERVDRTTSGSGPVRAHSWHRLQELDAGSWFAPGSGESGSPAWPTSCPGPPTTALGCWWR
ncbi:glycerophosphodiester phosphodiesterase [Streptomyces chiangmaiensis]